MDPWRTHGGLHFEIGSWYGETWGQGEQRGNLQRAATVVDGDSALVWCGWRAR
jgi:hypothetical protein